MANCFNLLLRNNFLIEFLIINSQLEWVFYSSSTHLNSCCPYLPISTAQCFNSLLEKSLTGLARKCCCSDKVEPLKRLYLCPSVYAQTPLFIQCHMEWHFEGPLINVISLIGFSWSNYDYHWFIACNIFWSTASWRTLNKNVNKSHLTYWVFFVQLWQS